jgi:hypothetical protein
VKQFLWLKPRSHTVAKLDAIVGSQQREGFEVIKNWVTAASIGAFALDLAAPGAFGADKPVYAVLMKTLSNQFFGAAAKGVDEGARIAGVDIILAEGQTGQWAASQVSACETILERKPAVMIAAAINSVPLLESKGCRNVYPAPAPATSYWLCRRR